MKLFTIGYSTYERTEFVAALMKHGIDCVVDVRSVPASKYRQEYNKDPLCSYLAGFGIAYVHMPDEFGARQDQAEYLNWEGYTDFGLFSDSAAFASGVERVGRMAEAGKVCALMCAEKDAVGCHRGILIGRRFHEAGWQVVHIMPDGDETHQTLEKRLLELYFPDRGQMSMLEEPKSDRELLQEAYRLQNRKIGFRKET